VNPDARTRPWFFVLDENAGILLVDDDPILTEFASQPLDSRRATARAAHGLKSMSFNIGATRLAACAGDIEAQARTKPVAVRSGSVCGLMQSLDDTCMAILSRLGRADVKHRRRIVLPIRT